LFGACGPSRLTALSAERSLSEEDGYMRIEEVRVGRRECDALEDVGERGRGSAMSRTHSLALVNPEAATPAKKPAKKKPTEPTQPAPVSSVSTPVESLTLPSLIKPERAAEILGRSKDTLKRWRYEGIGPKYVDMEGRISYDVQVLRDYIVQNTRVPSVRAAMEEIS
jgi:hypothetical protein